MTRPNQGKSYIVSTEDLPTVTTSTGLTQEQVQALIDTALQGVYTKAESDAKYQAKTA